ncbi:4-aminobutyrate--2-oxoglutarate transaminase [Galactobacter sp.]|uniref:4-aminobutyrate--2-oxoglutarate transaminase n=1 Tax=Galactobacter sp. TaxID=2676125 RepID=UPI0025B865F0|nr:4-aminobutyrate--2-oxoglutarate transaminase [Galactobacter sp.]
MTSTIDTPSTLVGGPELPQQRKLVTALPGPKSKAILDRKVAAVAAPVTHSAQVAVVAAGGGVVVDADGNSLIDLGSGIAVTSVGNSHPRVVAAVTEQVARFTHTCFTVSPYEGYIAVAEKLNALTPGDFDKRTALFNSGAEAVENAIKIARHYTGRQAVVALEHAYHGRTNLTMGLTSKAMPYKSGYGPFAPEIYRVPGSYPYRDHLTGAEAAERSISMIEKQVGGDQVAAIIVEPIQGEGGFIVPADGYLNAIQDWARANGVVFIVDEVQTGFARTGSLFVSEQFGLEPDLVTTAKGMGGGMPISGVTGRAEIMNSSQGGGLGGTYTGNPVSCAASLATIEAYEEDGLIERAQEIGELINRTMTRLQASDPRIGDVRGRGAMAAIELVDPATGAPDADLVKRVAAQANAEGVIVLTCGTFGNVIRFLPPLSISDELLAEGLGVIAEALKAN